MVYRHRVAAVLGPSVLKAKRGVDLLTVPAMAAPDHATAKAIVGLGHRFVIDEFHGWTTSIFDTSALNSIEVPSSLPKGSVSTA
jgi:hypothetical protein